MEAIANDQERKSHNTSQQKSQSRNQSQRKSQVGTHGDQRSSATKENKVRGSRSSSMMKEKAESKKDIVAEEVAEEKPHRGSRRSSLKKVAGSVGKELDDKVQGSNAKKQR